MSATHWHYTRAGAQQGPVPWEQLQSLAASGQLQLNDLVWNAGMSQWAPAASVPCLIAAPPPLPGYAPPPIAYYAPGRAPAGPSLGQDAGMRLLLPVGRSGWAIAAGYLGLFSVLILPAPIAIIISIIAILDIKKHPDRHGMGRAIFGLIMGVLCSVLFIAMIINIR